MIEGSLIERFQREYPDKNAVYTAVRTLQNADEIEQFMAEYARLLLPDSTDEADAVAHAGENVGYVLSDHDLSLADRWINHPIIGPTIPWDRVNNLPDFLPTTARAIRTITTPEQREQVRAAYRSRSFSGDFNYMNR